jgi:hypothetical protein
MCDGIPRCALKAASNFPILTLYLTNIGPARYFSLEIAFTIETAIETNDRPGYKPVSETTRKLQPSLDAATNQLLLPALSLDLP